METQTSRFNTMRLLAWCMPAFIVWFGTGFGVLGHNIPPYNGAFPTADLAHHFLVNHNILRFGFAFAAPGCILYMCWSVGVYGLMKEIRGDALWAYVQLLGGTLTVIPPMIACIIWTTAAYRPEQDPHIIQMLFDLGWMTIDIGFAVTTIQYIAIAVVFLQDTRETPLIPKWMNWLGVWIGLEFFAEIAMPYFRSGPFSWSGIFNYWIPYMGPFAWSAALSFYMLKAITRLEHEAAGQPSTVVDARRRSEQPELAPAL